ncbi:hypothetical protein KQX54_001921 [Cotesia glomerata]|uniref:Uncharacterized protein n=1 Tax=Cotesia glomerata TaxID=32391 RepID=A0AAV7IIU6_COTGL|nr:hypothetical protein KQX54_001921 [Cotesia glomerata]
MLVSLVRYLLEDRPVFYLSSEAPRDVIFLKPGLLRLTTAMDTALVFLTSDLGLGFIEVMASRLSNWSRLDLSDGIIGEMPSNGAQARLRTNKYGNSGSRCGNIQLPDRYIIPTAGPLYIMMVSCVSIKRKRGYLRYKLTIIEGKGQEWGRAEVIDINAASDLIDWAIGRQ